MRASAFPLGVLLLALFAGCGSGDTFATTLNPIVEIQSPTTAHSGLYVVQGEPARFRVTWKSGLPPHLQADYADNCWLEATFPDAVQPCQLSGESMYVYEFLKPSCDSLGLHTLTVTLHENRHWVADRQAQRNLLGAEVKDLEAQITATMDPAVLAELQQRVAEKREATATLDTEIAALSVPVAKGTLSIQVVGPLTIDTKTLPKATDGRLYAADVTGTGGLPPYTWSAPALPEPLAVRETTMGAAPATVIEGWAKDYGALSVTVEVTDRSGQSARFTYDLVIKPVVITMYFCGSGESAEDWDVTRSSVKRPQLLPSLGYLDRSRFRLNMDLSKGAWDLQTRSGGDYTTSYRAVVRGVSTVKPPDWVALKGNMTDVLGVLEVLTGDLNAFINLNWEAFFLKLRSFVDRLLTLHTDVDDLRNDADSLIKEIMTLAGEHQTLAEVMNVASNLDPSNESLKRGWKGCQDEALEAITMALAHETALGQESGCPFVARPLLNLVGYSRGAVQCLKVARALAEDDQVHEINIISMDPAPGEAGQNPVLRWRVLENLLDLLADVRRGISNLRAYVDDLLSLQLTWKEFWEGVSTLKTDLERFVGSLVTAATPPYAEWWTNITGATTLHDLQYDAVLPPKVSRFVGIYAEDERSYRFEPLVPIREDEDATAWWTFSVPGSHQTMTNRIMHHGHAPLNFYAKGKQGPPGGGDDKESYKFVVAVVFKTCEELLTSSAWGGLSFGDFSDASAPDADPEPALLGLARDEDRWDYLIDPMVDQVYDHLHDSSFLPRIACWRPDLWGCFSRVSGGLDAPTRGQPFILEWNFQIWPGTTSDPFVGPLDERVCFLALHTPPSASDPELVYSLTSAVFPVDPEVIEDELERMTEFPEHPSVP